MSTMLPTTVEQVPPSPVSADSLDASAELDHQLGTLLALGYPALAGLTVEAFTALIEPLREPLVARQGQMSAPGPDRAPFVVVVGKRLAPPQRSVPLLRRDEMSGFISADLADIGRFEPIAAVQLPGSEVYALLEVERGDEYLNWTPDEASSAIVTRARSVLTYDEGVALLTHFPELLAANRCFMLGASRGGDRRVPALWISGGTGKDGPARRGAPKLGWCWAGNRHTWLGHASCAGRIAVPPGT